MSDNPSSPLLGGANADRRVTSMPSDHLDDSHEDTPLLARLDDTPRYDGSDSRNVDRLPSPAATSFRSLQDGEGSTKSLKGRRRLPTITAIVVLGVTAIAIIIGIFFAPAIVREYAKEAMVIQPTNLSIDSFTASGVRARVQAEFRMDASRVENKHVRNIGRLGTWVAREVESQWAAVDVYFPEYGNILAGTADIPPVVVDIRNGHSTAIDFLMDLRPGDINGIRQIANDWLDGRLDQLRLMGKADIGLKSGLFSLGSHSISESLTFKSSDIPAIPQYNITRLNFHEVPIRVGGRRGMAADVSLSLVNSFPLKFTIPPLGFDILVPNCESDDPYIRLADATTDVINIEPYSEVVVNVGGIVRELPEPLMQVCPNSQSSPLDLLLGGYIHGNDTTIYVRGSNAPDNKAPAWVSDIISSITVPVPFPGHTFDKLIKSFSLKNSSFGLPDPFADPDSDKANPTVSGDIVVIAGLPKEMNFGLNVSRVRATADVFYKGKNLGVLDLDKWLPAKSERIESKPGKAPLLKIESHIDEAILRITNQDLFQEIIQQYLFGNPIKLNIKAAVDIEVSTVLGKFVIKNMPAEGSVPLKPVSRDGRDFSSLKPQVGNLSVLSTDRTTLNLRAQVNFTNPTEYSAVVPYFNIHILNNGSVIGDATVRNVFITTGNNTNVAVRATWDPVAFGGKQGAKIGRELLSQYISGFNTTLTFQAHEGSIAHQPELGNTLSNFPVEIPTPKLSAPGKGNGDDGHGDDGDDKSPHFIQDATFHLFSSTAQFTLISPLQKSTIYIDNINATAIYNHTETLGTILYDLPFKISPGGNQSPRLPVDVNYGSVGYGKLKEMVGGTLKLDAKGTVKVRLGHWTETVWYAGNGIGTSVRF